MARDFQLPEQASGLPSVGNGNEATQATYSERDLDNAGIVPHTHAEFEKVLPDTQDHEESESPDADVVKPSVCAGLPSVGNRKEAAQVAYKERDLEKASILHNPAELAKALPGIQDHEEPVSLDAGVVKPLVFGGLDGIITTFAVVAGAVGAELSPSQVLVMGFANLIADGFSMGFGEYISSKSELQYVINERNREAWEMDNFPEGEMKEMVEIYKSKGISEDDACIVISTLAKYKEFFVDHMMVEELGLLPPDLGDSPVKQGLIMFVAFCFFGAIPLVMFLIMVVIWGKAASEDFQKYAFFVSCCLTALTLMILGAVKARYTKQAKLTSSLMMLLNGTVAGTAAFLVGEGLNHVFA